MMRVALKGKKKFPVWETDIDSIQALEGRLKRIRKTAPAHPSVALLESRLVEARTPLESWGNRRVVEECARATAQRIANIKKQPRNLREAQRPKRNRNPVSFADYSCSAEERSVLAKRLRSVLSPGEFCARIAVLEGLQNSCAAVDSPYYENLIQRVRNIAAAHPDQAWDSLESFVLWTEQYKMSIDSFVFTIRHVQWIPVDRSSTPNIALSREEKVGLERDVLQGSTGSDLGAEECHLLAAYKKINARVTSRRDQEFYVVFAWPELFYASWKYRGPKWQTRCVLWLISSGNMPMAVYGLLEKVLDVMGSDGPEESVGRHVYNPGGHAANGWDPQLHEWDWRDGARRLA